MPLTLEHVNGTVTDAKATAAWMKSVCGWKGRWEGSVMGGAGYTVHIGDDKSYIELYAPAEAQPILFTNL